jgi:AcrR family transcriptional regulator
VSEAAIGRRSATRARLLDAAERLFVAEGYSATSIGDICKAADFTRGAFYSNFANKDELFLALLDRTHRAKIDATRQAFAEVDLDNVLSASTGLAGQLGTRDWFLISTEFTLFAVRHEAVRHRLASHEAALRETVAELLSAIVERIGRRFTIPAERAARIAIALIDGAHAQSYLEPEIVPPRSLEAEFLARILLSFTEEIPAPD